MVELLPGLYTRPPATNVTILSKYGEKLWERNEVLQCCACTFCDAL